MKTFIQWTEMKKLPLPELEENTKRAGIAGWAYPSAYSGRGYAYPDGYFAPIAADHGVKLKSKPRDVAPPDSGI